MATRPPITGDPKDIVTDILTWIANFIANLVGQIFSRMNDFIASLSNYFSSLVSQFLTFFNKLITYITSFLEGILVTIGTAVQNLIESVSNALSGILSTIESALSSIVESIGAAINALVERIGSFLEGFLERMQDFFLQAWDAIKNATISVIDAVRAYAADIFDSIRGLVSTVIDAITGFLQTAVNAVKGLVEGVITYVAQIASVVKDTIVGFISTVIDAAVAAFNLAQERINAEYQALLAGAESILATVSDRIGDLRKAFGEASADIVKKLTGIADEQFKPIRESIKSYVAPYVEALDAAEVKEMVQVMAGITSSHTLALNSRDEMAANIARMMPKSYMGQWLFTLIFNVLSSLSIFSGVTGANAQMVLQEFAVNFHYQLLSPADSLQAWRHENLSRPSAVHNIVRQGYSPEDAEKILDSSSITPALQDLVSMLLRGLIDEETFNKALSQGGLDGAWPARIKQASQVIPPVQDLITMAVREAFSPEVASRFGQYEDFPDAFAEWAKKQGLSEEWARRYWAAHWGLPSLSMGYEMLHRGVIEDEDLDLLLRAQDVMPFWRDRLKAISYSPLTRVDVRRMHQIGVLTEDEVRRAYLDIGYNEENAQRLTAFTVRLNKGAPVEDEADLGKLSRTTILGFYADGVIPRVRAHLLLVSIGITQDAASLYLDAEDFADQRRERKAEVTLAIEQAEAGTITWEQAQDKLNKLGLSTLEVQKAMADLLRAQQRKVKLPTQANGEDFFVAGVIDERSYSDLLSRLGYAPVWRDAFLKKAKADRG
jgi:hypothetical protein